MYCYVYSKNFRQSASLLPFFFGRFAAVSSERRLRGLSKRSPRVPRSPRPFPACLRPLRSSVAEASLSALSTTTGRSPTLARRIFLRTISASPSGTSKKEQFCVKSIRPISTLPFTWRLIRLIISRA